MPHGRRREYLQEGVQLLLERFAGRILPFDEQGGCKGADIQEALKTQGIAISAAGAPDCIRGRRQGALLSPRARVHPFQAAGLEVINPWG